MAVFCGLVCGLQEFVVNRKTDHGGRVLQSELFHDVGPVALDCPDTDPEYVRNRAACPAVGQVLQDFEFSP